MAERVVGVVSRWAWLKVSDDRAVPVASTECPQHHRLVHQSLHAGQAILNTPQPTLDASEQEQKIWLIRHGKSSTNAPSVY